MVKEGLYGIKQNESTKSEANKLKDRTVETTFHAYSITSIVFIHKSYNLANVKSSYQIFSVFFFNLRSFISLFVFYTTIPRRRGHRIVVDKKVIYS